MENNLDVVFLRVDMENMRVNTLKEIKQTQEYLAIALEALENNKLHVVKDRLERIQINLNIFSNVSYLE